MLLYRKNLIMISNGEEDLCCHKQVVRESFKEIVDDNKYGYRRPIFYDVRGKKGLPLI